MSFFNIIFISFALAMDAFTVSISNGITLKKINTKIALKFGLFFGLFQFFMPIIGFFFAKIFQTQIKAFDHWIAFILLTLIGGKMFFETFKNDTEKINFSDIKILSFKNLSLLAIATSIDALAVGVSFSVLNQKIFIPSIIIGFTAFLLSFIGIIIGKKIGELFSKSAERVGGLILIFIGFKILIKDLFF